MDCPKCGTHNPDEAKRCRLCGAFLRPQETRPAGTTKNCAFCGTTNDRDAPFCTGCGRPMGSTYTKADEKKERKEKRAKSYERTYADYPASAHMVARAGLGGILIILAAFFALVDAVFTLAITWQVTQLGDYDRLLRENPDLASALANMAVCQGLRIVFIFIAFAGGIFAVRRLRWGLSMVGGVLCILSVMSGIILLVIPFWWVIELSVWVGAIIGVVLVGISRREFMLA